MKLLAVGGAHIDRRGQVSGDYRPAASNPGVMREDIGGGALNALRNAVQRGIGGAMLSIRGGDGAGAAVAETIAAAGIDDLSAIFLDRTTPSYTAIIDRHGELVTGFADMALYDLAFPKQLRRSAAREAIAAADAVLADANVPAAGLERIAALAAGKPLYAIGVSPAKVVRLADILPRLSCLFVNRGEAETLCGQAEDRAMVGEMMQIGLRAGVITSGGAPVVFFEAGRAYALQPPAPRRIADVTGAGDALTGATVAALLHGRPLGQALREGVAASLLAIESPLAVAELTEQAFSTVLALVPQPQAMA